MTRRDLVKFPQFGESSGGGGPLEKSLKSVVSKECETTNRRGGRKKGVLAAGPHHGK